MSTGRAVLWQREAQTRAKVIANPEYWPTLRLPAQASETEFGATVRITFDCLKPGASSFVDLDATRLISATLNGRPLDVGACVDGRLPLDNLAARNELVVTSVHELSSSGAGLTRVLDSEDGDTPYFHTQFEDFHAHKTFACFDQPDIKGRFTWSVEAPGDWDVRTNTAQVASEDLGQGMTRRTFARTEVLPTYLAATVAGPYVSWTDTYTSIDGREIPLGLSCRRSQVKYVEKEREVWFAELKKSIRFLEEFYGFPYPFPKYEQVLVPGFKAGAMENPGLVTFYEQLIFRGEVPVAMRRYLTEVIGHECAHVSGFGDVRTMVWWDDLWLNETFATTMAALMARQFDHSAGTAVSEILDKLSASELDQMPTSHPVATAVANTDGTHDNFDSITYEKGFAGMAQLIAYIGLDSFRRGVQRYFASKWNNATRLDFWDAMQAEAPAGADMRAWAKQWFESKGMSVLTPIIDVDSRGRIRSATVAQSLAPNADPVLRTHVLDIGLYDLVRGRGLRAHTRRLRLRCRLQATVAGPLTDMPGLVGRKRPAVMLVNDTDQTYAKSELDDVSLATVEKYIGTVSDTRARAQLWTTMWHLTRDAKFPASRFVRMVIDHAETENEPTLLHQMLGLANAALGDTASGPASSIGRCVDARQVAALTGDLTRLCRTQMNRRSLSATLRREWFDAYCYMATKPGATQTTDIKFLSELLGGRQQVRGIDAANDPDIRWQLVTGLVRAGALNEYQIRLEGQRDKSIQGQARLLQALASIPDPAAKEKAYGRVMQHPGMTPQEMRALMAGFATGKDELRRPLIGRFVSDVERISATRPTEQVEEILGNRGRASLIPPSTPEGIAAVRDALASPKVTESAKRKLTEALDRMERAQACQRRDADEVTGAQREVA